MVNEKEPGGLPGSSQSQDAPSTSPPEVKNEKQIDQLDTSIPIEEQKKNVRPERTANFKDYLVSKPLTFPLMTDVDRLG